MSSIRRDGIKRAGAVTPEQEGGTQGTQIANAVENVRSPGRSGKNSVK